MPNSHIPDALDVEKFMTLKAAAEAIGVPYWKLHRAVKSGQIPSYTIFNSRKLVRLSEILSCVENSSRGDVR